MLRHLTMVLMTMLLASCSKGFGHKLTDPEIDVYFEFGEDEVLANKLGKYWKSADLTGSSKQSIRLTKDDEFYYVQLIANEPKQVANLPFNELKLLLDLQSDLDSAVFNKNMNCQIVLCDNRFTPLFNINH